MEADPQQTEELKELVRQSIALSQENNKMLHSMRRGAWFGHAVRLLWIVAIVIASYYSYLYLMPYLSQLESFYGNLQSLQQKASSVLSTFSSPSSTTTQQR